MLIPDDIDAPPLTDEDLEAYWAWEDGVRVYHDDGTVTWADENNPPKAASWSVCDTGSAEWAMRRAAHAQATIAEVKANAKRFKEQIERWEAEQLRLPERALNFFTGLLESYARRKREEDGLKTLKLPSGAVTSRLNPARADIPKDAEEQFIEWARSTPMVKAKWSPVMAEVKKRVTFERVMVPDWGDGDLVLVRWPGIDGEAAWVAVPESMADAIPGRDAEEAVIVAAEDLPNFHAEVWPICEGQRVPGVVEVPAEVRYTVVPEMP